MAATKFTEGQLTPHEFDIPDASGAGADLVGAPAAGLVRKVHKIELATSADADITVTDGDGATVTPAARGFIKDSDEVPWYISAVAASINVKTSAAVRVAGRLWYEDGAKL